MSEQTTMWLTKYALTGGIRQVTGTLRDGYLRMGSGWEAHRVGDGLFADLAEAVADAEARRTKKMASLRKQIGKLEKLRFVHLPTSASHD